MIFILLESKLNTVNVNFKYMCVLLSFFLQTFSNKSSTTITTIPLNGEIVNTIKLALTWWAPQYCRFEWHVSDVSVIITPYASGLSCSCSHAEELHLTGSELISEPGRAQNPVVITDESLHVSQGPLEKHTLRSASVSHLNPVFLRWALKTRRVTGLVTRGQTRRHDHITPHQRGFSLNSGMYLLS